MKMIFPALSMLCALYANAAGPSFQDFQSTQFNTSVNKVRIANSAQVTNLLAYTNIAIFGPTPQLQLFNWSDTNDFMFLALDNFDAYGSPNFRASLQIWSPSWSSFLLISSNGSIAPLNGTSGLLGDNILPWYGGYVLGTLTTSNLTTLQANNAGDVATANGAGVVTFQAPASVELSNYVNGTFIKIIDGGGINNTLTNATITNSAVDSVPLTVTSVGSPTTNMLQVLSNGSPTVAATMLAVNPAGQVLVGPGRFGAPGLSFATETNTGLYLSGAGQMGVSISGTTIFSVTGSGIVFTGTKGVYFDAGGNEGFIQGSALGHILGKDALLITNANFSGTATTNLVALKVDTKAGVLFNTNTFEVNRGGTNVFAVDKTNVVRISQQPATAPGNVVTPVSYFPIIVNGTNYWINLYQ